MSDDILTFQSGRQLRVENRAPLAKGWESKRIAGGLQKDGKKIADISQKDGKRSNSMIYIFDILIAIQENYVATKKSKLQGFGSAFFFADPDPGKNFDADPDQDPDPGGIRGRGLGVKGKMNFFLVFFTFQMILNNGCLKSEQKK